MDRNLYKSDKKLASQGWRAMRQALDREMPEARRRPVAFFWVLALLAPTAGLLGWLMLGPGIDSYKPAEKNNTAATTPAVPPVGLSGQAALIPETSTQAGVSQHRAADNNPPIRQLQEKKTNVGKNAGKGWPVHKATAQSSGIAPEKNTLAVATPGDVPPPEGKQPASDNTITFQELFATAEAEPAKLTEDTALSTPTGIMEAANLLAVQSQAFNPIPAISAADTLSEIPFSMPSPPVDPVRNAAKNTWAFGANTGVSSDTKGTYAGTGAGLSAEWKPLKKWGIRSGVGYQFRQLNAEERPIVALTASTYVGATGDAKVATANESFNVSSQSGPAPVYVAVGRVHRIEMPVLAFWQPVSKLRIFGGLAIGNNLRVEAGDQSLNKNVVYHIQNGSAKRNLNNEVSDQLRSWDTHWSIGVGFKPTRQLELDLFFQSPFELGRANDTLLKYNFSGNALDVNTSALSPVSSGLNANSLFSLSASWFFK